MPGGPDSHDREVPEDLQWKSLAVPGLDEDDIFAALLGVPGTGAFWGDGRPSPFVPGTPEWTEEDERRRRREEILGRWAPLDGDDAPAAGQE